MHCLCSNSLFESEFITKYTVAWLLNVLFIFCTIYFFLIRNLFNILKDSMMCDCITLFYWLNDCRSYKLLQSNWVIYISPNTWIKNRENKYTSFITQKIKWRIMHHNLFDNLQNWDWLLVTSQINFLQNYLSFRSSNSATCATLNSLTLLLVIFFFFSFLQHSRLLQRTKSSQNVSKV